MAQERSGWGINIMLDMLVEVDKLKLETEQLFRNRLARTRNATWGKRRGRNGDDVFLRWEISSSPCASAPLLLLKDEMTVKLVTAGRRCFGDCR